MDEPQAGLLLMNRQTALGIKLMGGIGGKENDSDTSQAFIFVVTRVLIAPA